METKAAPETGEGWTAADFALTTRVCPDRNPYPAGSHAAQMWARGWRLRRSGRPCPVTGRTVEPASPAMVEILTIAATA